jgi:uncharacterized lipoprotein YajG
MPMTTLKNSLILLALCMLCACQTAPHKPLQVSAAIATAQATTASASVAVRSAIDSSKSTTSEIKRIRTTQDRVDAKSVLILKWLELQR